MEVAETEGSPLEGFNGVIAARGFGTYEEHLHNAEYNTAMVELAALDDYGFLTE